MSLSTSTFCLRDVLLRCGGALTLGAEDLADELDTIRSFVASGWTLDDAAVKLKRMGADHARVDAATDLYRRELDLIVEVPVMKDLGRDNWFSGTQPHHQFWPAARARLSERLDARTLAGIDQLTTATLNAMSAPGSREFSDRGLVLGYVQSGKTTNFTALAAKAVDAGYKLVIVLAGLTDNLRWQTQVRLDADLVGVDTAHRWQQLTNADSDFVTPIQNAANMLFTNRAPLLAVVKKNSSRLRALSNWLSSAGPSVLGNTPILVIDDEADQASLNTAADGEISRINELIREVVSAPKVSYVAYTATPFANLLINPAVDDDLYPRTFIVSMPCPETYFGASRVFGSLTDPEAEPIDMVRPVSQSEVAMMEAPRDTEARLSWSPQIGEGLRTAIDWFLISTAVRRVRDNKRHHSTMLVHTSMLSDAHYAVSVAVNDLLDDLRRQATDETTAFGERLRRLYNSESARVPAEDFGHVKVPFDDLVGEICAVLNQVRVIVDNYVSDERLSYGESEPTVAIVIGGNTLSRGLTLEGLTSSYFVRTARTYDTLMQMGRWFGYRDGYEDLCRVWVPLALADWFEDLSEIESELRTEIDRYALEKLTPLEAAVRIRLHPSMSVTAANKMRYAALASYSYSGTRPQTTLFDRLDRRVAAENFEAARQLVLDAEKCRRVDLGDGLHGFDQVPVASILRFISRYAFHPDKPSLSSSLLSDYIKAEAAEGALQQWRVVVMGQQERATRMVELGDCTSVGAVTRSRLGTSDPSVANIRALASGEDYLRTLTLEEWGAVKPTEAAYGATRYRSLGNNGVLRLYVIDKDSRAKSGSRKRVDLAAVADLIGVALDFPISVRGEGGGMHISAAIPAIEPDWEEELAAEELAGALESALDGGDAQ